GALEIDRVHWNHTRCRPDHQPPRPILARFLRFQDSEEIAEAARRMVRCTGTSFTSWSFLTSPNLSPTNGLLLFHANACFTNVGIKFSMMYPAVLSLKTVNGRREFTDPKKSTGIHLLSAPLKAYSYYA
ncbi:hypothetical protein GOODEAATRI_031601, partial [Goodea atripinnis]